MRSMHSVHFFITPSSASNSRAPYGQAHEHNLQPMHRLSLTSTIPSSARLYEAPVGQTVTQAASSQCRQDFGKCTVRAPSPAPSDPTSEPTSSNEWMRLNHTPQAPSP